MPEITKGKNSTKYSTIQIPIHVKTLLKEYRDTFRFSSYGKALMDALELSLEYRKLGQLVVQKEMKKEESEFTTIPLLIPYKLSKEDLNKFAKELDSLIENDKTIQGILKKYREVKKND